MDMNTEKSLRKKRRSIKLQGFYVYEKGQTVLSSSEGLRSKNDDDSPIKIIAKQNTTSPGKEDSAQENATDSDQDKENGHEAFDDPRSMTLDDGPNLDWHIFPSSGDAEDSSGLCSGNNRPPIRILADVHSASPPGYISEIDTQNDISSLTIISPKARLISPKLSATSPLPAKNGCIVSREDRIIFHKRLYGSPTRKSTRIRGGASRIPVNPPQQADDVQELQPPDCLVASSVGDSPVSEVAIEPNIDPVENEESDEIEAIESDGIVDANVEKYTHLKEPPVVNRAIPEGEHTYLPKVRHINCLIEKVDADQDEHFNNVTHSHKVDEHKLNAVANSQINSVQVENDDIQAYPSDTVEGIIQIEGQAGIYNNNQHSEGINQHSEGRRSEQDHNISDVIDAIMETSLPANSKDKIKIPVEKCLTDGSDKSSGNAETNKWCYGSGSEEDKTLVKQVDSAVGVSPCTGDHLEEVNSCDTSINTSTEEFVSADEMLLDITLPHNDKCSQDKLHNEDGLAEESLLCTPPMTPTWTENQSQEMQKSLTKVCSVMLKRTPTPTKLFSKINLSTKFESNEEVGLQEKPQSTDHDLDDSYHSVASGEEKLSDAAARKRPSRQKSREPLTEFIEEIDNDDDAEFFPVSSKKKFASQFQKFLLLTKDLDDTPSDKGSPPAKTYNTFQDSPATLLAMQLGNFSLDTPSASGVQMQISQGKEKKTESNKIIKKRISKKKDKSHSSSPVKRRCFPKTTANQKSSLSKGSRNHKTSKCAPTVTKESSDQEEMTHIITTPLKGEHLSTDNMSLSPTVNLAKHSDKCAIQEYFSPAKLKVNIGTPTTEIKKHCSPSKLFVNVTTPIRDIQRHCSSLRVNVTTPTKAITEYCTPRKLQVRLGSPPAKVLEEACKNVCISLSKDDVIPGHLTGIENTSSNKWKQRVIRNHLEDCQRNDAVYDKDQQQQQPEEVNQNEQLVGKLPPNKNLEVGNTDDISVLQDDIYVRTSRKSRRRSSTVQTSKKQSMSGDLGVIPNECESVCETLQENRHRSPFPCSEDTPGNAVCSFESKIQNLEYQIQQVSLQSTRKKRKARCAKQTKERIKKLNSRTDTLPEANTHLSMKKHTTEMIPSKLDIKTCGETIPTELKTLQLNTELLENNLNVFTRDLDVNQAKAGKTKRKTKPSCRKKRISMRLHQRCQMEDKMIEPLSETESWETESVISRSGSVANSEPLGERLSLIQNQLDKLPSSVRSTQKTDTESMFSVESWATDSIFTDDFMPFPDQPKRKTSSKRRSLRIAKRQSLQLGIFDNKGSSKDTEKEDRSISANLSALSRKRSKSCRQRDDISDLESVISTTSYDSEIVCIGEFHSSQPKKKNTNTDQSRTAEEQRLWEDFDVDVGSSDKQLHVKQQSRRPARRISSRLKGGCASLMELTVKGNAQEVPQDVVRVWSSEDTYQGEVHGEIKKTDIEEGVCLGQDIAPLPVKKNRRRKKIFASTNSIFISSNSASCEAQRTIGDVDNNSELKDMLNNHTKISSDTPEEYSISDHEFGAFLPQLEDIIPLKKDKRLKKSVRSRRRSSQCFKQSQSVVMEDLHAKENNSFVQIEICNDQVDSSSGCTGSNVDEIFRDLEVGVSPSKIDNVIVDKKGRKQNKHCKSRCLPASFKPQLDDTEDCLAKMDVDITQQSISGSEAIQVDDIILVNDLEVGTSPTDKDCAKKARNKAVKSRRHSSKSIKPIFWQETEDNFITKSDDQRQFSVETNTDNKDDIINHPNVGTFLTQGKDHVSVEKVSKCKNTKKSRRRSSHSFKPVVLEIVKDHDTEISVGHTENVDNQPQKKDGDNVNAGSIDVLQDLEMTLVKKGGKSKQVTQKRWKDLMSSSSSQKEFKGYTKNEDLEHVLKELEITQVVHSTDITHDDILTTILDVEVSKSKTGASTTGEVLATESKISHSLDEDTESVVSKASVSIVGSGADNHYRHSASKDEGLVDSTQNRKEDPSFDGLNVMEDEGFGIETSVTNKDKGDKQAMDSYPEESDEVCILDIADFGISSQQKVVEEEEPSTRARKQSRRLVSRPKIDYSVIANGTVSPEDKPKSKRKDIQINEDIEQLYISKGKSSNLGTAPSDCLETIFESPVRKRTGTPILHSKRKYNRKQTFPEKPWRSRPGKSKQIRRKHEAAGCSRKKKKQVDEVEVMAHLDEVLADLSEFSVDAMSPKKTTSTPYPKQSQSRIN